MVLLRRYCKIMSVVLLSVLLHPEYSSGSERVANVSGGIYGNVRDADGTPVESVDVSIFDGLAIHNVKTDDQGIYKIPEISVSPGNYAVLFFTKKGYIPIIANIRVEERKAVEYTTVVERSGDKKSGFVIGTVYQPIRGGKIKFQSGIYGFGKDRRVWLESETGIVEKRSDMDGHFLFEVPPGKYRLGGEVTKEKAEVDVQEGETVIKNLRSGLILID